MVKRPVRLRLGHIREAIDEATSVVDGLDLAAYRADFRPRRIVERRVEIISEAVRHIPQDMRDTAPDVPWDAVEAIGNLLRHRYIDVDDTVMWKIATRSLPELRAVVDRWIAGGIDRP